MSDSVLGKDNLGKSDSLVNIHLLFHRERERERGGEGETERDRERDTHTEIE